MSPAEFATRAIGVPFMPFGRDYDGLDCWGCVHLGYREVLGIDLPSFDGCYASAEARQELDALITGEKQPYRRVETPQAMDVVLLKVCGALCHCGLIVKPRAMLHVIRGSNTCIEDYTGLRWAKRIEGFYRHDLAS